MKKLKILLGCLFAVCITNAIADPTITVNTVLNKSPKKLDGYIFTYNVTSSEKMKEGYLLSLDTKFVSECTNLTCTAILDEFLIDDKKSFEPVYLGFMGDDALHLRLSSQLQGATARKFTIHFTLKRNSFNLNCGAFSSSGSFVSFTLSGWSPKGLVISYTTEGNSGLVIKDEKFDSTYINADVSSSSSAPPPHNNATLLPRVSIIKIGKHRESSLELLQSNK